MFVGFDYGTSNCAMAHVADGEAHLIPLYNENPFTPSTVYAIERAFIAEAILHGIIDGEDKQAFVKSRSVSLGQSRAGKIEHSLTNVRDGLFFGQDAIEHYIAAPGEGYFIKSPKSFLGASGLRQQSIDFFEDVVAAMMLNIKNRAEQHLGQAITQAVIGRPVNFQGINSHHSNQQAQAILTTAGKRVGFSEIEFLFEPLAAGFDFETRLTDNKCVLVVDVGGGTTDCSMVLMGPDHIRQLDRRQDFLGHSGERVGGNDFDIQLAQKLLMPAFGINSFLKTGLPMPVMPFVNAMAINDVSAQADFYDANTTHLLDKLSRETLEPSLLNRFTRMRNNRQNFAVVREAENAKITLSSVDHCEVNLDFVEPELLCICTAREFADICEPLLQRISVLIMDAVNQAGKPPDIIYITGGSAKSPLIRHLIGSLFGEGIKVVDGDHFGSVAAGLAVWAQRVFK